MIRLWAVGCGLWPAALRTIIATTLSVVSTIACASAPEPKRIVSLNMCVDAILVELVPRDRIVALSQYSRDPRRSVIANLARQLPFTYETAEEVVSLKPDLVLTGRHSAIATRNALKRVGIRFEVFDVPMSIAQSHEQIRYLAGLLQTPEAGEALIKRIDDEIAAARPTRPTPELTAAVYQPGGLTAGADTITDELMRVVGLDNLPARVGVKKHRGIALESLLRSPPDILLVGDTTEAAATHAERIINHRALRALGSRMVRMAYPAKLQYCAGPTMTHAVKALEAARDQTLAQRETR